MLTRLENVPDRLRPYLIKHTFRRGERILAAGGDNQAVYFVAESSCIASIENADGTAAYIDRYGKGSFFGELEVFCDELKTVEVIAGESCLLYSLHRGYLLEWMREDFDFTMALIRQLAASMMRYSDSAAMLQLYSVKQRAAYVILTYDAIGAVEELTKQTLSALVRTPVRSVNRALAALAAEKAVSLAGRRITVLDREKLRALSDFDELSRL